MSGTQSRTPWDPRIGARAAPDVDTKAAVAANHAIWLMIVSSREGGYGDGR